MRLYIKDRELGQFEFVVYGCSGYTMKERWGLKEAKEVRVQLKRLPKNVDTHGQARGTLQIKLRLGEFSFTHG